MIPLVGGSAYHKVAQIQIKIRDFEPAVPVECTYTYCCLFMFWHTLHIEWYFFAVAASERSNRCVEKVTSDGVVATINSARKFSDPNFSFLLILTLLFVCVYTPKQRIVPRLFETRVRRLILQGPLASVCSTTRNISKSLHSALTVCLCVLNDVHTCTGFVCLKIRAIGASLRSSSARGRTDW